MFANISIKNKVLFLVLIPIIFLAVISLKSISFDKDNVEKLKNLENGVILSTKISSLVHETQKERGLSAVYLSKTNAKSKNKLSSQIQLTNKKLKELNFFIKNSNIELISENTNKLLNAAIISTNKLKKIRKAVIKNEFSIKEMISYYSNLNSQFFDVISTVTKSSSSPIISKKLLAYSNFLLNKERAGLERALVARALTNDYFSNKMLISYNTLISEQNIYMKTFFKFASKESIIYSKKILNKF